MTSAEEESSPKQVGSFPFELLPKQIQTRILTILLVAERPLQINSGWTRSRIAEKTNLGIFRHADYYWSVRYQQSGSYAAMRGRAEVVEASLGPSRGILKSRTKQKERMNTAATRYVDDHGCGLAVQLFRVSRDFHKRSALLFYGRNTFVFPVASNAWLHLESFLGTIGLLNASLLRTLHVHVPMWESGLGHAYMEGALLDLASHTLRLAVPATGVYDRLLSAVKNVVSALMQPGSPLRLTLLLKTKAARDLWIGARQFPPPSFVDAKEAAEHVARKHAGIALLKSASAGMLLRPVIVPHSPGGGSRVHHIVNEAEKYGWVADPTQWRKRVRRRALEHHIRESTRSEDDED